MQVFLSASWIKTWELPGMSTIFYICAALYPNPTEVEYREFLGECLENRSRSPFLGNLH